MDTERTRLRPKSIAGSRPTNEFAQARMVKPSALAFRCSGYSAINKTPARSFEADVKPSGSSYNVCNMKNDVPNHIGFIPDGNRRWAMDHGLPKEAGYD